MTIIEWSLAGHYGSESALWSAIQWADDEGVLVADLIPAGLPTDRILGLLHQTHPTTILSILCARATAGVATLVHTSLALHPLFEREEDMSSEHKQTQWIEYAQSLKRFAPWESALLLINNWQLSSTEQRVVLGENAAQQREIAKALFGPSFEQARWAIPILLSLLAWQLWVNPMWGLIALITWMVQPTLILFKSGFSTDLARYTILRPFIELFTWIKSLGPTNPILSEAAKAKITEDYQADLSRGLDSLFQTPQTSCPLCGSDSLNTHLIVPDYISRNREN